MTGRLCETAALSRTTALRLTDAVRQAGQTLDPALAGAVGDAPLSFDAMQEAIAAGAFVAIEDLLLRAMTKPDFFLFDALYDPQDEQRLRAPIHILDITVDGPERFFDYSWLRKLEPSAIRYLRLAPCRCPLGGCASSSR